MINSSVFWKHIFRKIFPSTVWLWCDTWTVQRQDRLFHPSEWLWCGISTHITASFDERNGTITIFCMGNTIFFNFKLVFLLHTLIEKIFGVNIKSFQSKFQYLLFFNKYFSSRTYTFWTFTLKKVIFHWELLEKYIYFFFTLQLISKLGPYMGSELLERILLDRYLVLCEDDKFFVRKVCASYLGEICAAITKTVVYKKLVSINHILLEKLITLHWRNFRCLLDRENCAMNLNVLIQKNLFNYF